MKRLFFVVFFVLAVMGVGLVSSPDPVSAANVGCKIPNKGDVDNNGIGDVGVQVVCNYTSVYAYDASGDWYWDLGDGRVYGTVASISALNQATLSVCNYQVHTKGSFNNDPYMDSGDISNMIRCYGYDGAGSYHYQIVHKSDPRYTGNPTWAIWGDWEYHVLTESHNGNIVAHTPRP